MPVILLQKEEKWKMHNSENKLCYLAYLDRIAKQGAEGDLALVPGQVLLQTSQWKILHDQLNSLTTYEQI